MQQLNESIVLGRRLIDRALSNLNSRMNLVPPDNIKQVLAKAKLSHLDDPLAEVGLGNQMASVVARRLLENQLDLTELQTHDIGPLSIKGTEGLVVTYARCCRPIPGDPIIGHICAGRGIVIHLESLQKHERTARQKRRDHVGALGRPSRSRICRRASGGT